MAGLGRRAPRELADNSNVPHTRSMSPTVAMTTDVGNSQFFAKYGIRPIHDSTDNMLDTSASTQACKITRLYDDNIRFPKLEDCAHFHYDFVELSQLQVVLSDDNQENVYRPADANGLPEVSFFLCVHCNEKSWTVRRTFSDLCTFDKQLHRCIYDRNYSLLRELHVRPDICEDDIPELRKTMSLYLRRFSSIAGTMINCGPILSWLEMDNRGNRLIVTDDSAINTPAVAAAHAIRRYSAKAMDEISFEVGDIISIIDMPPFDESSWWRGKRGFEVGFFPSDTVEVISEKVPQSVSSKIPQTPVKPVLRKRGKLISFLRTFFTSRPTRTTLKRTGIMKERIFGCDLGEHLLNSGHDVPLVLKSCADVIEAEGIVDGIYRLSGVASNIHRLRNEFDEDRVPDLEAEVYQQDIHSVSSLVKMYFRELPNPLLTYQLYDKFAEAVQDEETKLAKLHDVIQQLPPPHYRTAEYLLRHLSTIAAHGVRTGMHCKNLAIVWAPNLLRSKELEQSCTTAALQGVGIQAIVTECLIAYVDVLFNSSLHAAGTDSAGCGRPKSLAISTPTRLLSLEEARERALSVGVNQGAQKYIEVGGGSATLPAQYHTVIDLPNKKKRKKSPNSSSSGWRGLFTRGKAPPGAGRGRARNLSCDTGMKDPVLVLDDDVSKRRRLRPVRSCDSLLSAATTTPVKHSAGQSIPRPVIDGASDTGVRSKSCDTSYEYELEYHDHSPLNDEGEVFTQPAPREPFPSNVFSHDTSAVTIVMASDTTVPKTNFMCELEEKLHSRSASIDSRSQWRSASSDRSHMDLAAAAEVSDVPDQCHSLPENFAPKMLQSPAPHSAAAPSGRPTSYDNMIYDVPKDLFARRLPGDAHVMRPSSAWAHENLGTTNIQDSTYTVGSDCVQGRNPGGSGGELPNDVQTSQPDDMHMSGVEGAACELAHYEESLPDDIFHGNSAANTDSESEFDRREAPSCNDDFSADIFNCLEKRSREETKEAFFKVQPDIDTPAEGATEHSCGDSVDVCHGDKEHTNNYSRSPVDATSDDLTPTPQTDVSADRDTDQTEYVTCVAVTSDMLETVDTCISDTSKSTDDNMTSVSDMSKSLDSVLEEAAGGSMYTLTETAESCDSDGASVTLGGATSQQHGSSSSIDSEIRAAVQLHEDTLHSSPPGLNDSPQLHIDGASSVSSESSAIEDDVPTVGSSGHSEGDIECHMAAVGCEHASDRPASATDVDVSTTQDILDGYLYAGGNQIELSDNDVEYVDPWQHETAESETADETEQDASSPPDDVLPVAPSYYDLYVAQSMPSMPAPCSPPTPLSPQAERGHIVIRRPVGQLSEGAVQQVQATRVAPAVRYSGATTPPLPPARRVTTPSFPSAQDTTWGDVAAETGPDCDAAPQYNAHTYVKSRTFQSCDPCSTDLYTTNDPCTTTDPCTTSDPCTTGDPYTNRSVSPTVSPATESIEVKKPVPVGGLSHALRGSSMKHSMQSQIGCSRFGERTTEDDRNSSDNTEAEKRHSPEITSTVDSEEASFTMRSAKDEYTPSGGVKRKKSVRELLSQFEKSKSAADGTRQTPQKEIKPCETLHETVDEQQRAPVVLVRPSGNVRANVDWSSVRVIDATRSCRDEESRYSGEKTRTGSPPRCARRSSLSFQQRFKQFESQELSSASVRQLGDCVASPRASAEKEVGPTIGQGQSKNVPEYQRSLERRRETTPVDTVKPEPAPRSCRVSDRWRKPDADKTKETARKIECPTSSPGSDIFIEEEVVFKPSFCPSEPSRRSVVPQARSRESINSENCGSLTKSRTQVEPNSTGVVRPPVPKTIIIEEKKAPKTKRISLLTEAERPKTLSERLQLFETGSSGSHHESQDKTGSADVGCGRKGPKEDVSVSVRGLSEKFEQRASLRRSAHAGSSSSQDSENGGSPSGSMPNKRLLVVDLAKPCGVAL